MLRFVSRIVRWFAVWRRFCALLVLIFVARAAFVLSVLPPFEGWDEYQHLAYIAYLVENGRSPILHDANEVPRSLYAPLLRYPHGKLAVEQVGPIGAVTYDIYWDAEAPRAAPEDAGAIPLYQAQQSPLYYRLVAPLYSWLSDADDILVPITALRAVNVLFGAASLFIALLTVGFLVRDGPHRVLIGLLIALQPLFLLNCARVANDALAVLLGTVVIALLLVLTPRRYWLGVFSCGLALGFALLAKTINLSLIPFVVFVFVWLAWRRRITLKQAGVGVVLLLGLTVAVTFNHFYFNLTHFGMLTPMQEAIANQDAGKGFIDLARAAAEINWWDRLGSWFFRHGFWFGGWSWLQPPSILKNAHQYNVYLAMLGMCFALKHSIRRDRLLFASGVTVWQVAVLCFSVAAGLGYHAVHSKLALGTVATNSWYAAVSFPWLLCLYYQGLAFYPGRWLTNILAVEMILIYLAAESYGTLAVMVPAYTGHTWGPIARDRLAQLHLPGFGPEITLPALGLVLCLVLLALAVWVDGLIGDRHKRRPFTAGIR